MILPHSAHPEPRTDTRRYWLGVALLVMAVLVAIVLVAAQGSRASVRARHLLPAPGSTVSVRPAIRALWSRPMDKGSVEQQIVVSPPFPFEVSWNENEVRLLPRVPLLAETEYTITMGPGVRDATGQPLAGQLEWRFRTRQARIAFIQPSATGAGELWLADLGGSGAQRLSAPGQAVQDFDAVPNGSTIVYTVEEGPNTVALWRADPTSLGLTRLTDEAGVVYSAPRFNPSGDLLAVEVRREAAVGEQLTLAPTEIELRRPSDGSPAGIVYGEGAEVGHTPRWSPDSTRLAFFEANQSAIGIFNFTSDVLFFPAESATLGAQAWDPTGSALTYTRILLADAGAQQVLALRDLGMGTEILRGEGAGDQSDPAWSPDGTLIAYAYRSHDPSRPTGLWIMQPDGLGRVELLAELNVSYSQPVWSPDSQWLVFGRFDLTSTEGRQGVWAMRRDGTSLHQIAAEGYQAGWVP